MPIHETTFHCSPFWKSSTPSMSTKPVLVFPSLRMSARLEHGRKLQLSNLLEQDTVHHFCPKAKK